VDAMSTFSNVEDPWNVHCEVSPYGYELISLLPNGAADQRRTEPRA
jgi:hypothetical protein